MSKLRDALKYLGTKVNGVTPKGYYVTDIIKSIADDYHGGGGGGGTQYTLTYAYGDYGDTHDSLPDPVTVNEGETVNIDFSTYPFRVGDDPKYPQYDFVGWAVLDGQSVPDYSEDGTTSITMTEDVTLYPVYVEHVASDYLAIDNTNGVSGVNVEHWNKDKQRWSSDLYVDSGNTDSFEYNSERTYRISYNDESFHDCVFTGVLSGDSYENENCTDGGNGVISAPDNHDWQFESGAHYLTVVSQGS